MTIYSHKNVAISVRIGSFLRMLAFFSAKKRKNSLSKNLSILEEEPINVFYRPASFFYVYGQIMRYEPTGGGLKLDDGTTVEYLADQIIKTKKEIREAKDIINLGIVHQFHRTFVVGVGAGLISEYVQSLAYH